MYFQINREVMSPVTHSFLGFQTCLIDICLFFVLASFWLFIFILMVLMLEERCNVLKLLNRKKRGQKNLEWCRNKKLTLCFLWDRLWCCSCLECWEGVRMLCVPSSWPVVLPTTPSCREEGPREEQGDEEWVRWVDSASPGSESKKSCKAFQF